MAIEAIQKVAEIEENVKKEKEYAQAESKQRMLDTQRWVRRLLEDTRQEAEHEGRVMMTEADTQAAKWTEKVLESARQDCESMKQEARSRLAQAVDFLSEKVVNS